MNDSIFATKRNNCNAIFTNYNRYKCVIFRFLCGFLNCQHLLGISSLTSLFQVVFHVDIHSPDERRLQIDLPKWWSMGKHVVIDRTAENAVRYDLVLPELTHIVQHYLLYVEPLSCEKDFYHMSASLIVPWRHETSHSFFT